MKNEIKIKTIYGELTCFDKDLITEKILKYGSYARPEFSFATSIIRKNFKIFDLGAHIGTFALASEKKIDNGGKILCLEGNLETFNLLSKNLKNKKNITLLNEYIGNTNNTYSYFISNLNNMGGGHLLEKDDGNIQCYSIDDLVNDYFFPQYIKIDIEGLEYTAISNSKYIKEKLPIIYVEINENALARNKSSKSQLINLLKNYGYTFFKNIGDRNNEHDIFLNAHIEDFSIIKNKIFDIICVNKHSQEYQYLKKNSIYIKR
tara:strand:- start:171 stop:956 length:786 start_codon:yes stop_codon:yes gene_type:complete